ncbi:MAG TPA: alkaline phosphatase family protein [Vicinamibacterales bacterium]|nr:alkaline phosphatase family protein [Vicinamibacterales bacterium]
MWRLLCRAALLVALLPVPAAPGGQTRAGDAVILVTLDGARIEEIFGGLDEAILRSTLRTNQRVEEQPVYGRFSAATPEERRARLMPFFWETLMARHGSIAGNHAVGSRVSLTNTHRFSYPGYSEILLGEAHDDRIKSNDAIRNPFPTVLEELRTRLELTRAGVGVFASWSVFSAIVEHTAGSLTVNAGYEPFESSDPGVARLNDLQRQTQTPWDSVRHDAYTFRFAMAHLEQARPRVMYLAFGETDDWAHDGRYDRVLEAYRRTDAYLKELWTWLQGQPDYRGRTHILITTDHGRGRTPETWRSHGAKVEGAQDVWIALISPRMPRRGEWRDHSPLQTNQVAATLAGWVGVDWTTLRPGAGAPIQ